MRDRLPQPGKEGHVKLTNVTVDPDGTIHGKIDFDDGATQEGSAWSKANVLPDDVVAYLGLKQSNPQPKDAFLAVADAVGDIKTTVRTDLGEDWLLCNGDPFNSVAYPDLATQVKSGVSSVQISTMGLYIRDITYGNGLWVAVANYQSTQPYVLVSRDRLSWTAYRMSENSLYANQIVYRDSKWVCVCKNGSGYGVYLLVSDSPTTAWTQINVDTTSTTIYGSGIDYGNGTWCIYAAPVSGSGAYSQLFVSETLGGTWTKTQSWGSSYSVYALKFINNLWVLVSTYNSGGGNVAYLCSATNPAGTWTSVVIKDGGALYDIIYDGTTWRMFGEYSNKGAMWSSTAFPASSSSVTLKTLSQASRVTKAVITNGYLNVVGVLVNSTSSYTTKVLSSNDGFESATEQVSIVTPPQISRQVMTSDNTYWVAGDGINPSTIYSAFPLVPTISVSDAYVYIRAK